MSICPYPCPSDPPGPPGRCPGAGLGLSPSILVRSKRLELRFPGGGVTLVLGKLGGGAARGSRELSVTLTAVERQFSWTDIVSFVIRSAMKCTSDQWRQNEAFAHGRH